MTINRNQEVSEALAEWTKEMDNFYKLDKRIKNKWKRDLKGLINITGLFKYLDEDGSWYPIGIVDIIETDEKRIGYSAYRHVRIVDDEDHLLYIIIDTDDIRKVSHYAVWQTTGYLGDDFSGYMLFPLSNGKYFKVGYSC
jgi:hypothetical protein